MKNRWFARFQGEKRLTSFHFCESEIEDRKITSCGRQMGELEGTELRVSADVFADAGVVVIDLCKYCQPKGEA